MEVLRLHVLFNTIQFKNHGDALKSKPFDSNKSVSHVLQCIFLHHVISLNQLEVLKVYKGSI